MKRFLHVATKSVNHFRHSLVKLNWSDENFQNFVFEKRGSSFSYWSDNYVDSRCCLHIAPSGYNFFPQPLNEGRDKKKTIENLLYISMLTCRNFLFYITSLESTGNIFDPHQTLLASCIMLVHIFRWLLAIICKVSVCIQIVSDAWISNKLFEGKLKTSYLGTNRLGGILLHHHCLSWSVCLQSLSLLVIVFIYTRYSFWNFVMHNSYVKPSQKISTLTAL